MHFPCPLQAASTMERRQDQALRSSLRGTLYLLRLTQPVFGLITTFLPGPRSSFGMETRPVLRTTGLCHHKLPVVWIPRCIRLAAAFNSRQESAMKFASDTREASLHSAPSSIRSGEHSRSISPRPRDWARMQARILCSRYISPALAVRYYRLRTPLAP